MTEPLSKIFRITFDKSGVQKLDIEASHIGIATGKALTLLKKDGYSYEIEDCIRAELVSEFVRKSD